jgi:hypothetical protein
LPDRRTRCIAAGSRNVPLRPINSVRSPLALRVGPSTSKKPIQFAELAVVRIASIDAPLPVRSRSSHASQTSDRDSPMTHST